MSEQIRGFGNIIIAGKQRPFHVNSIRQTRAFCEVMNCTLDEYWLILAKMASAGALTNTEITIAFLYSALFAGAKRERIAVDFSYEDVLDWFEDASDDEATELLKPLLLLSEMVAPAAEGGNAEGQLALEK